MPNLVSPGTQYRTSSYTAFYTGHVLPVEFTLYDRIRGADVAHDLTQYTGGVFLQFLDAETDSLVREQFALAVLTADADKVPAVSSGVACRCRANILADVAKTPGAIKCKVVGKIGTTFYLLDSPWLATIFRGGPTAP